MSPATRPATALLAPRRSPPEARMRPHERAPVQIANGAKIPKGKARRPSARARVAPRSLIRRASLPELPAAQEDVQDRADAPDERDHDPQHLPEPAQVLSVDDVDHAQDESNGVQKDREQDLDNQLHHARASRFTMAWSGLGMRGQ